MALLGETSDAEWAVDGLLPGTSYCWKVIAKDDCGETEGPVWTFTTASASVPFSRGDTQGDGEVDLTAAVVTLTYLFASRTLSCLAAADVNDDGTIDLTDAVDTLSFLFLGTAPPAAPFPGCGVDTSANGLGCASYPGCS